MVPLMRDWLRFVLLSPISVINRLVETPLKLLMAVSSTLQTHLDNHTNRDKAAAVLLMKRSKAIELGQPILAKYVGATVAGLPPRIMGIGPSIAIPKLLNKYNITVDDLDVIEVNEAFASMAVYCKDVLKLPHEKMNPRGGAIALGHPLGATGTRQIVTGLSECRRQKKKILLTSMCIGTGMGMAGLFVNEQL
jgi:acetyl-CoA acyltransferase 1